MNVIVEKIKDAGAVSVEEYMRLCLQQYYNQKMPFGREGDFITAPEISQMFGELIGACLQDVWNRMGKPEKIHFIELGPGKGTLMADILRSTSQDFKEALDIHLVEASQQLQAFQKQALKHDRLFWHNGVESALGSCSDGAIFCLGNEFYDALPVQQYQFMEGQWFERLISWNESADNLEFSLGDNFTQTEGFPPGKEGDVFEVNHTGLNLFALIAQAIKAQGGLGLFIDYGHDVSACGDTLQAISQHQKVSVFSEPGQVDLTTHVDFQALSDSGSKKGLKIFGPVYQKNFLTDLGLHVRAQQLLRQATLAQQKNITQACKRLTDPREMGTLFKVMAVVSPATPSPYGFESCTKQVV